MRKKIKIGFIGVGNMGEAILVSLIKNKIFKPAKIGLTDTDRRKVRQLAKKHCVCAFSSNFELVDSCETIVLAVKPQQISDVLEEIKPHWTKKHLLLSIAAGVDASYFKRKLKGVRLIRIMPNLCITIGEGTSALFATTNTKKKDRQLALKIFSSTGLAVYVKKEESLDTITALSGSGPAFVYLFMDALIEAGTLLSLPQKLATNLVLQTLLGSSKMAISSKEGLSKMIEKVTSKGGTTEAGLKVLSTLGLREVIRQAIAAATQRGKELKCTS